MKITIDRAVLDMALAALKKCDSALSEELAAWDIDPPLHHVLEASNSCGPSIAALQAALVQPQQEPGRNHYEDGDVFERIAARRKQKARKPLTDERLWKIWNSQGDDAMEQQAAITFARAIEAAHGIKESK